MISLAVKELRYAGRRIVEAFRPIGAGDDDEAAKSPQLQDAELDCYRARRGAIDAATAKIAIHLEAPAPPEGGARATG